MSHNSLEAVATLSPCGTRLGIGVSSWLPTSLSMRAHSVGCVLCAVCTDSPKRDSSTSVSARYARTQNQWNTALLSKDIRVLVSSCQHEDTKATGLGWSH